MEAVLAQEMHDGQVERAVAHLAAHRLEHDGLGGEVRELGFLGGRVGAEGFDGAAVGFTNEISWCSRAMVVLR